MNLDKNKNWKVITHLVHVSLDNINGLEWRLYFCKYTDETRKSVQGGQIGYADKEGKIIVTDKRKYRVLFTKDEHSELNEGRMVWLEYEEKKKE